MQAFQQFQFGLEIDVVRQLEVRDEARGLDVIRVGQHKLFVLRRASNVLAVVRCLQGAVDQRHGHRLAFAEAKHQPVAAGKVRVFIFGRDKTVHHFTLGHQQFADVHRKTQLFRHDFDVDIAAANFGGKRVVAPVATLGGVGQRQQIALVAAHQLLQAGRTRARVNRRRAGDVIRCAAGVRFRLRQALFRQQAEDVRRRFLFGVRGTESWRLAVREQREVQQTMGVVVSRAKELTAGNVFVHR